ncbi:MAG TPA: NADP-dependent oxidoreductase [Candidatus Saccharimonadales bacterium]|nr:NADP-dependent oxidoreductase [Candidatus Saccharimonadales bacterium]
MKAALLVSYGGQDAVKIDNTERPEPSANEVQIEVVSASVNPFDYKVRDGLMQDSIRLELPIVIGGDVAGIVRALGDGVTEFSIGDQVYGQANALKQGSIAEYTVVNISQLALKPKVDFETSAALPLASVSAYQALYEHLKLTKDQKILIHGGGGGIGSVAIQLAKNVGAHVATTASKKDEDYVLALGADMFIDYHADDFTKHVKEYDCVFDTVGGETFIKSYEVVRPGGKIVTMASQPSAELDAKYDIHSMHQSTKVTTGKLNAIAELVNDDQLKIHIDKLFDLTDAPEALEYLKTGHPRGKVVVQVKN